MKQLFGKICAVALCTLTLVCCTDEKKPEAIDWNAYRYFGMIDPFSLQDTLDLSEFPEIPGLSSASFMYSCPNDTCFSRRYVLLLRCPEKAPLLDWVNRMVGLQFDMLVPPVQPNNVNDIIRAYEEEFLADAAKQECSGEGSVPNEQNGLLIADYWQKGRLCTFYVTSWYDMLSCGNNTRVSYYTLDAKTGEVQDIEAFVAPDKLPAFAAKVKENLKNEEGEPKELEMGAEELLAARSGCARIPEGIIVYYHPYVLSYGAEGAFQAIVPIDEL